MRLHVLVGCGALLRPVVPPPEQLADLIQAGCVDQAAPLRIPSALWLARGAGVADHDFLLKATEDRRIEVFAAALRENFGARAEPLVILPDALGTPGAPAAALTALAALRALWRLRPAVGLTLHALVLPDSVDGSADGRAGWVAAAGLDAAAGRNRLEALRDTLAVESGDAAAIAVATVEPEPHTPVLAAVLRNALAQEIGARAAGLLAEAGLAPGPRFAAAAARRLAAWSNRGLTPILPVTPVLLDRLTARVVAALSAEAGHD